MKRNRKYTFLTPQELTSRLVYGEKKEYDFTFDDADMISSGETPSGWFGVKLMNLFDGTFPDCLAIGYWGGGDTQVFNLEYNEDNEVITSEQLENLIERYLEAYFAENDSQTACVEL